MQRSWVNRSKDVRGTGKVMVNTLPGNALRFVRLGNQGKPKFVVKDYIHIVGSTSGGKKKVELDKATARYCNQNTWIQQPIRVWLLLLWVSSFCRMAGLIRNAPSANLVVLSQCNSNSLQRQSEHVWSCAMWQTWGGKFTSSSLTRVGRRYLQNPTRETGKARSVLSWHSSFHFRLALMR